MRTCICKHARTLGVLSQVGDWKAKSEATEKREAERREAEARKHKEEVSFLEGQGVKPCTHSGLFQGWSPDVIVPLIKDSKALTSKL